MNPDRPTQPPHPQSSQPDAHTQPPAGADAGPSHDGILDTLADLETRVNNLRSLHTQSAARATELMRREAELTRREGTLADRESGLAERETGLEHRFAESRRIGEQIELQQRKMAALEQSLEEQRAQIDSMRSELAREAEQNSQRAREAHDREQAVGKHEERLTGLEGQLREHQTRLGGREDAVAARERKAAEFEAWATVQRSELDKRSKELDQRVQGLEQREREQAERLRALEAREQAADRSDQELGQRQHDLAEQQARLSAQQSRLERMHEELDDRQRQVTAESERVGELEERLAEMRSDLEQRLESFEHESDVSRSSLDAREAQVRALEATLEQQRESIKAKLDELERERAAVAEQQRTLIAQAQSHPDTGDGGAISSGRVEMLQIQIGEANALRAGAEEELSQAREELERLRLRLSESESTGDRSMLESDVAKRDHAILVLRERMQELQTAYSALKQRAIEGRTDGSRTQRRDDTAQNDHGAGWNTRRRSRLARYKTLLQQQARKVMSAQAALQKRHAECEQVLSQRHKLSQLAQELGGKERRLALRKARSGALLGVLVTTVASAVLGVMSWQAALRLFPGQYVARAVIEADTHGQQPDADDLAAWQKYHEELTTNPQMMEVAAQRMGQRGIASLARAAELTAKLKADLYTQTDEPGRMTIELKETGASKAQMVLDTYVTALKSVSDAGREQRSEDLGVRIVQTAAVDERPLNEQTIMGYAGGIFAGALLGVGLFGMLIWTRLLNAKKKFDQSQAVEEALSEVDWANLERSFSRSAAGESVLARPVAAAARPDGSQTPAAASRKKKGRN